MIKGGIAVKRIIFCFLILCLLFTGCSSPRLTSFTETAESGFTEGETRTAAEGVYHFQSKEKKP